MVVRRMAVRLLVIQSETVAPVDDHLPSVRFLQQPGNVKQ